MHNIKNLILLTIIILCKDKYFLLNLILKQKKLLSITIIIYKNMGLIKVIPFSEAKGLLRRQY